MSNNRNDEKKKELPILPNLASKKNTIQSVKTYSVNLPNGAFISEIYTDLDSPTQLVVMVKVPKKVPKDEFDELTGILDLTTGQFTPLSNIVDVFGYLGNSNLLIEREREERGRTLYFSTACLEIVSLTGKEKDRTLFKQSLKDEPLDPVDISPNKQYVATIDRGTFKNELKVWDLKYLGESKKIPTSAISISKDQKNEDLAPPVWFLTSSYLATYVDEPHKPNSIEIFYINKDRGTLNLERIGSFPLSLKKWGFAQVPECKLSASGNFISAITPENFRIFQINNLSVDCVFESKDITACQWIGDSLVLTAQHRLRFLSYPQANQFNQKRNPLDQLDKLQTEFLNHSAYLVTDTGQLIIANMDEVEVQTLNYRPWEGGLGEYLTPYFLPVIQAIIADYMGIFRNEHPLIVPRFLIAFTIDDLIFRLNEKLQVKDAKKPDFFAGQIDILQNMLAALTQFAYKKSDDQPLQMQLQLIMKRFSLTEKQCSQMFGELWKLLRHFDKKLNEMQLQASSHPKIKK